VGGEREVAAGAGARVSEAGGEELLKCGKVKGKAFGLAEFGVPGETQPEEVFAHGGGEFGTRALGVDVFVAKVESAVGGAGTLVGDEEGASVAEVKESRGRGSEAADGWRGHGDGTTRAFFMLPGIAEAIWLEVLQIATGSVRRRCQDGGGSRSSV
jgi:hypothetical protein